jgi:phosphoribosyl 1,2-cyclic phosphodiesterase
VRLSLLGSGSSGNVAFFETAKAGVTTRLLVDAGLPRNEIENRLCRVDAGLSVAQLDAILLTHDHNDHAGCAPSLGRPIVATAGTARALELASAGVPLTTVRAGEPFSLGAFTVRAVALPHDAEEPVGYVVEADGARAGILTDCGHDAPEVAAGFAGCDVLVLECNYDATMLRYGPYPPSLKRRVGGRLGHLSNDQAASLLKQMIKLARPPKLVVAAHLSQANNRPQLAKSALDRVLGRGGKVLVATQGRPTSILTLDGRAIATGPLCREQLSFDFARPREQLQ